MDLFADLGRVSDETVDALARMLEQRGQDTLQVDMRTDYLSHLALCPQARVLEVGCGTGVVTRHIATFPGVEAVVGIDTSARLLEHARALSKDLAGITFEQGDGRDLALFPDASFDATIFHTTLSHMPEPGRALAEAFRVLRPCGSLAIFDGDYATTRIGFDPCDPLQVCVEAWKRDFVYDCHLVERLESLMTSAGFQASTRTTYAYTSLHDPTYLLNVFGRGVDALVQRGIIGDSLAASLKSEATARLQRGAFIARLDYASWIAQKGAQPLNSSSEQSGREMVGSKVGASL